MSFIYHRFFLRVGGTDIFTHLKYLKLESLQLKRLDGKGEYACELLTLIVSNLAYKLGSACPPSKCSEAVTDTTGSELHLN